MLDAYKYAAMAPVDQGNYERQEVFVENHPVITRARRGDLIRVILYVENMQWLHVLAFQMNLLHELKKEEKMSKNCNIS